MFRRSRFSIRPNVSTVGRTAATSQEAPSVNQEASEAPKDAGESSTATAVTESKSVVTPSEKPTAPGDGNDQNGDGTSTSAAVQRRKRFSVKPKVAPGRPSALARTPKSPAKAVSETTVEIPSPDPDKPTTSSQSGSRAAPQGLQSPRRRRPSEDSKQPKVQPKPTLISSDSPGPSAVPPAEDSLEQTHPSVDSGKQSESTSDSQVKEVPPRPPDKVPPSLPNKEATELSEKAKTLVSSKRGLSMSPPEFSLSRLLNDPSDLQRLAKARKLRELLKQEMHKEKKLKKSKARAKEYTLDPAKMTMRDLIRYLPVSNPMSSSLEDSAQENETVLPPSPEREESPERAQEPEVLPKIASPREEVEEEEVVAAEVAEEEEEEEQEDSLMVPQVKVAEDGSLIIDEESLTVEVLRAKGPNPAQGRDPIFERGSTTTYSSFRKGTYSKPWSSEETDMFFLAVNMVGTDFSMICQLFPHRARSEIKNKFKKEERENSWRIDKAFRERRKLDIEYFSKLLEKILEVQKNRKKLKSLSEKNSPKKHKRKTKGKKAARKLSDVDEEDEDEESELPDIEEEEGEKENEDLCNEGGTPVSKPKRKRKRKNEEDASTEEPNDKKKQMSEKTNEQGEACIPEDAEALPEDRTNSDMSDKTETANTAKDTAIKPAKLSRGRAPKPLLPLGRKWGKKPPPTSTKAKNSASDQGDESVSDGASKEQVNKEVSPSRQANERKSANDNISSEDEDYTVQPPKPTRYGRVPKPIKHLNYLAKEDAHSSASETTPASTARPAASDAKPKAKCTTKRGRASKPQSAQESKKPKLVTLRASQSDYSDEDDENQREEKEVEEQWPVCSSSMDSSAPVFVPATVRSPYPGISEVEETMEELDILANMPDVLGISQDALCPDASCELVQNETGTAEPCEHQLDLLVDVIDFLSSEHTEVSEDESYNEAAQTLLTIGNLAHLSQSAQNQTTTQDHITGITSVSINETSQHIEVEIAAMSIAQEETSATPSVSASSGQGVTETSETVATVEPQNSATDKEPLSQIGDLTIIQTSDQTCSEQKTVSDMDSTPQLQSSPEISKQDFPQTRRGHLSKVKPKPNLGRSSRTALSKSQPDTSTVGTAEESQTVAPDLSQATEIQPAVEETTLKLAECSPASIKDDISSENQNQSFSDRFSSDTAFTESQVEQRSNTDSVTVQESSDPAAASVTPAEELPVCQKEESEVASTNQTRKSRFQKVKPKPKLPQISRTVRSKPQTTKDPLEKDTSSSSNLEPTDKTIEIESQPTCTTCPEKPTTSVLIPSLDLGSTLIPTEEMSSITEKNTDIGLGVDVDQADSGAATLDQSDAEAQFEPSWERATRDIGSTSESTDEKLMSHAETTMSSCNNPVTSDSAVTESQVEQRSNTDSVTVQESSDPAAASVTHAEELPVCQKEESEVASTNQTRKSRFQKVKPKPKLPQISRTVRSKPQTTKDPLEKDTSSSSNLESTDKTIEIESQPTCTTCPEKPTTSVSIPSLDLGSTLIPTEEMSSITEKNTDIGLGVDVDQADSGAATLDQSDAEAQFEPSWERATRDIGSTFESTDEKLMSHAETTMSSCNNPVTSDSAVTESQVEQRSNTDSVTVQESSDPAAASVTPAEELPVCQKEESEVASTNQTRRSRFQKVKPKPKLPQMSRTVRSKPQTTKDPLEKDTSSSSNLESTDKTIEIESQPTCTTCPEKPTTSVLIPSLDLGSTLIPTEEMSSITEKNTDIGLGVDVDQADSGAATLDQSDAEAQFEPSWERATRDIGSTSESTDEKLMSHAETTMSSCNNPVTSDSAVTESQVEQRSNTDSVTVQESSDPAAASVTPAEELPVCQKEESEVASTNQTRKSRFQKVKPKPKLPQISRTVRSKSQTTKDPLEKDTSSSSNLESTDKTIEIESQPTCTTCPEKPTTSVSIPSLDLGSTLIPTEEMSSITEKNTDIGLGVDVDQADSGAATLDQSDAEAQFEPSWERATRDIGSTSESTDEKLMSHAETTMSSCNNPVTSDSAITESQVEQRSNTDSVTVQESSDRAAASVTPAEELPVCQKEESEDASTNQTRRSRFQKVKPKPKLPQMSRTVRSKHQTTKDPLDKDTSLSSNLEPTDKTIAEIDLQPTCTTCPEKPSTSVLIPSLDLGSTHIPTEELSSITEKKTDIRLHGVDVYQADSGATTLDQSDPEAQFEPSWEQATRDIGSTSESTDEKLMSHAETTASSCNNPATSDSAITESQVEQRSNTDSVTVQESSDRAAASVTPAEELPVCQKEESEDASTNQTRRSRFQKVKPKPKLPQMSRTVRSKPQTTKDPLEKDTSLSSNLEPTDNTIAEIESQPTCTTCSEKPSTSVLIPSLDLGSTHIPTEELSSIMEKKTDIGLGVDVDQADSGAATLDQSDPEAQFEPSWEQATGDIGSTSEFTDEKLMSHAETTVSSCNNTATSDSAITESQVEQRSNTDSVTVQESSDRAAASVTHAEELPVCQKEESEVASTNQTRRSRFQKVKPKPKLPQMSRTVRSKPQTTKYPLEKNTSSSSNLESTDKTIAEIELQPTCTTCPEKPSTSVLIPSLDLGSTLIPTEELSSITEKNTDIGLGDDVDQADSGAATLDQSDAEAQFEPSWEQATRDIGSTSESTDEKLMSHAETTASSCNNPATSDSAITESQVRRGEEGSDNPAACVTPVKELPVSQKEESEVSSTCQIRRSKLQKVKPNLPQTSRIVRSKPQTTKDPVAHMQLVTKTFSPISKPESSDNTVAEVEPQLICSTTSPEKLQSTGTASVLMSPLGLGSTHEPTEELSSTEEKNTNVGLQLDSNSEGSEQNVPQRRRRFAKAKPNLGSSTRTTQSKLQPKDINKFSTQHSSNVTSEQQPVDNKSAQTKLEATEKDSEHLTSPHSENSLNSTNEKGSSSDSIVIATTSVAENQSILTDSAAENENSEKPAVGGESTGDSTSSHNKVEASKDASTESKIKSVLPVNVQSTPDPRESTRQQHSENESEIKSQDSVQQVSETTEATQTTNNKSQSQCTDDTQSSRKSPQARRGRLIKPKPNLGRSARPPQPQQVQNTTQAETDSGTCSEDINASGSHRPVTDLQPDIQEPVEGVIEQLSKKESPPNDAGASSGCVTQTPENSTQVASTSSTASTQSFQSITIFPDMLSVPSDPDEPFFILSLTEIPVCSLGEVVDSASELLPYLPVTDASIQQQSSVSGESVAAGGHDVVLSNVLEHVSTEETGETGLINVKDTGPDPCAYISSIKENPVDPHGTESTEVQPPMLPNTVENSEETNILPTKQRLTDTRRRAKLQIKPSTTRKKQASKTLAAKEAELIPIQANTIQDSELPGPSVQPEAFDAKAGEEVVTEPLKGSSDHEDIEKKTCGKNPEDSSSGAQARGTSSRTRKSKGFLSFPSETDSTAPSNNPPRGKAASKGPKIKTLGAARKRSTPAPAASTSRSVAPTTTVTQIPEEPHSTSSTTSPTQTEVDIEQTAEHSRLCSDSPPSTSQCTAEVSVSQQSDCVESCSIEEEPTSVSQYFLSDIFTEVEEG